MNCEKIVDSTTDCPLADGPGLQQYATPQLRLLGGVMELTAAGTKPGKETGGNVRGRTR